MSAPMLTPHQIRARLERGLTAPHLAMIILDSSSRIDLMRLAAREGLIYPGIRMESIPPAQLAEDLARDALADPDLFATLASWLSQRTLAVIEKVRGSTNETIEQLPAISGELLVSGRLGPTLWALLTDPRPVVEATVSSMVAVVEKKMRQEDKAISKLDSFWSRMTKGLPAKKDAEKARDIIRSLAEDLHGKEKELRRLQQENAALSKTHSSLSDRITILERALEEAQNQKMLMGRKLREAEENLHRLGKEIQEVPKTAAPFQERIAELERELHHQQREFRRVRYDLEKIQEKCEGQENQIQGLKSEGIRSAQELEALKNERDQLLARTERLAHQREARPMQGMQQAMEEKKDRWPPIEKRTGRVGVFLDAYSLFLECRTRSIRLNYEEVLRSATAGRNLIRAIAFMRFEEGSNRHEGLAHTLERSGFQTRLVSLLPHLKRADGWKTFLTREITQAAQKYALETAVLIGFGQEEGLELAKGLHDKQFLVEVFSFRPPQTNPAPESHLTVDLTDPYFHWTDRSPLP